MFLALQIACTVLSALCVAAIVPIGICVDWGYAGFCAFVGILFFVLMKVFKTQRELREMKSNSNPSSNPDFLNNNDKTQE